MPSVGRKVTAMPGDELPWAPGQKARWIRIESTGITGRRIVPV
jgi:hypothetical protein